MDKLRVKLKKSLFTTEHYGNRVLQLANYIFFCDKEEYEKFNFITVTFEDPSKIPKGWIKQSEREGYNPYIYVVTKDMIEVLN